MTKLAVCRQLGYTPQAYYKSLGRQQIKQTRHQGIRQRVVTVRRDMPRLGTRKLHHLLEKERKPGQPGIGRDWLFNFLRTEGLLVTRKKKYVRTTDASQWRRQYPNLVQNKRPNRPEQLWVADITYLITQQGYRYLHLLTDAYSKKIMGYAISEDLSARHTVQALQAALLQRQYNHPLIHHSDRGVQYCSGQYTQLLQHGAIRISMTQDGSPYENAVAERINGILKQEYGLDEPSSNDAALRAQVKHAVASYNNRRPHWSCWLNTPEQMHQQDQLPVRQWHKKTAADPSKQWTLLP